MIFFSPFMGGINMSLLKELRVQSGFETINISSLWDLKPYRQEKCFDIDSLEVCTGYLNPSDIHLIYSTTDPLPASKSTLAKGVD